MRSSSIHHDDEHDTTANDQASLGESQMTTIDTPEIASSPDNPISNTEPAVDIETSKPVRSSDAPVPSAAGRDAHTEEQTDLVRTAAAEAEQVPHVSEEDTTPNLPARLQAADPPAERISPEVESLKAMFPDFDVVILQSVLESVNGDQERAADVLLGMSDPNYVSQQHVAPSQSDLDEQLARRLMLEEQQQQASWHPDQQYPLSNDRRRGRNVPYQPRTQQGGFDDDEERWGSPSAAGGGGRDTMSEVQEQFSKFAESGKKTFSSLVTKVKAKMQEFDQSRNASGSTSQPSWGSGTPSTAGAGAPPGHNQYSVSPAQTQFQGQYFAPPTGGNEYGRAQGYDAIPQTQPAPVAAGQEFRSSASPAAPVPPAERIPPRPPSAGPPPAGNVDPIKIGMLPKRPVSLLGGTSQSNTNTHRSEDEDELDYVENPFEEGKK